MKIPTATAVASIFAGFALGYGLPLLLGNRSAAGAHETAMRESPRRAAMLARPWEKGSLGAGERMAAFLDHASGLTPAEWPEFFRAQQTSPEWWRLAAQLWAETDPQGFWDYLRGLRDRSQLLEWGRGLLQTWALANPDAAMEAVLTITDKETGDRLRRELVDTVLNHDLATGLELAAKAGDFNRFSWGQRPWITENPEAAVRGLASLPMVTKYRDFLKVAIVAWVEADPQAALAWIKDENPRRNEPASLGLAWIQEGFNAAAKADPQAALTTAIGLENPQDRDQAIAGVLTSGKLDAADLPALLAACTPMTRYQSIFKVIGTLPKRTPVEIAAATEILIHGPASSNLLEATAAMAIDVADHDMNRGWEWAVALPDVAMRRAAMEALAERESMTHTHELAGRIANAPLADLSNAVFKAALKSMSEDQREAWIAKLPDDRSEWARQAIK